MPILQERHVLTLLSILVTIVGSALAQDQGPIIKLDPSLDAIISPDTKPEKLVSADDFGSIEGPVWSRNGGFLIYSDMERNILYKWNPKDGKVTTFLDKVGFTGSDPTGVGSERHHGDRTVYYIGADGVTMDKQGRVVFTAMGDRQIVRLEKDGTRTVLAKEWEGKRLNGTNDLVYKSDGALYFTDPPIGLRLQDKDPKKEIPFNGVMLLKDEKVQALLTDLRSPNGLCFSPNEKIFYVNDSAKQTIWQFDVNPDDTISNRRVFIDMTPESKSAPGVPDGMKVDREGNVYSTGPGGVWIISPAGKHMGTVLIPGGIANNLAFGDSDGKTLYVPSRTGLYRIRFKIVGIRP